MSADLQGAKCTNVAEAKGAGNIFLRQLIGHEHYAASPFRPQLDRSELPVTPHALRRKAKIWAKRALMWARIMWRLCRQPHRKAWSASPSGPSQVQCTIRPSVLMCQIIGSSAILRPWLCLSAGVSQRFCPAIYTAVVWTP